MSGTLRWNTKRNARRGLVRHGAACKRNPRAARDRAEGLRGFSDATMATSGPEGGRPPIGPRFSTYIPRPWPRDSPRRAAGTSVAGRLSSSAFPKSTCASAMADTLYED